MTAGISASTVKSWFQYRCERKTRYDMMSRAERDDAVIIKQESGAAWAREGDAFEERVLERLAAREPLLAPAPGKDRLDQDLSTAFLQGKTKARVATQLALEQGPSLRGTLGLSSEIQLNRSYTDLVFRDATPTGPIFRIVDVKATRQSTPFHKAQVALYAHLLDGMLADLRTDGRVSDMAEIWHFKTGSQIIDGLHDAAEFKLRPYRRLVEEFLKRDAPRIASRWVSQDRDETFFHIYFKCEQCDYLGHCRGAIERPDPANNDVSAVAGVSQEGKRALLARRIATVGDLVAKGLDGEGATSWSLQRRSDVLASRAKALASDMVERNSDTLSYLMPRKVDRAFYLLADHDAVEDTLVTLGYVRTGGSPRTLIRVIERGDSASERQALIDVFTSVIEDLEVVDAHNRAADPDSQLQAHIFVYEPAEARAIQAAIGRHLNDPQIRAGLLHAVRLFPPDDVVPEPEFKGAQHLPATALRSVVEQLYALPCKVAYDLRQVSEVLASAGKIALPYAPDMRFKRDFSSLLGMEIIRSLRSERADRVTPEDVALDVEARLSTTARIVEWLIAESAAAPDPFLRLDKQPFQFQTTLDPLDAGDLDLLHAYELLESRSGLLETLVRLAQPLKVRQVRGDCLANLTLDSEGRHANGRHWLRFLIPKASRDAEISPDEIGLILTDDNPDLRLNPSLWPSLQVRFNYGGGDALFVNMSARQYNGPLMNSLRRTTAANGWCIDKIHRDLNGPRVQDFLMGLGSAAA